MDNMPEIVSTVVIADFEAISDLIGYRLTPDRPAALDRRRQG